MHTLDYRKCHDSHDDFKVSANVKTHQLSMLFWTSWSSCRTSRMSSVSKRDCEYFKLPAILLQVIQINSLLSRLCAFLVKFIFKLGPPLLGCVSDLNILSIAWLGTRNFKIRTSSFHRRSGGWTDRLPQTMAKFFMSGIASLHYREITCSNIQWSKWRQHVKHVIQVIQELHSGFCTTGICIN